jgi:hypothetical protein
MRTSRRGQDGRLRSVGRRSLTRLAEADAYLAMTGTEFPGPGRDEWSGRGKCLVGELSHAAMWGLSTGLSLHHP